MECFSASFCNYITITLHRKSKLWLWYLNLSMCGIKCGASACFSREWLIKTWPEDCYSRIRKERSIGTRIGEPVCLGEPQGEWELMERAELRFKFDLDLARHFWGKVANLSDVTFWYASWLPYQQWWAVAFQDVGEIFNIDKASLLLLIVTVLPVHIDFPNSLISSFSWLMIELAMSWKA